MNATAEKIEVETQAVNLTKVFCQLEEYSEKFEGGYKLAREILIQNTARIHHGDPVGRRDEIEAELKRCFALLHGNDDPGSLREPTRSEREAIKARLDDHQRRQAIRAGELHDLLAMIAKDEAIASERSVRWQKESAKREADTLTREFEVDDAHDRREINDGIPAANKLAEIANLIRLTVNGVRARERCLERRKRAVEAAEKAGFAPPEFPPVPEIARDGLLLVRVWNSGALKMKL